jgi:tetratricopeptide (TPR) repeat protein
MQESTKVRNPPTFAGFLGLLARRKFRIGVDHHLRLQRLLETIGGQRDLRDLKTLLCPIFATSVKQQTLFYETFDRYFEGLLSAHRIADLPPPTVQRGEAIETGKPSPALTPQYAKPEAKWPYAMAVAVVFVLVGSFAWWRFRPPPVAPAVQQPRNAAPPKAAAPTPQGVTTTLPQPQVTQQSELQHIFRALRWAAVPVPLMLLGFYELRRYRRRKQVVERKPSRKPPYQWQFDLEETAPKLVDSESFYQTARLMRQRQTGERQQLDVEATIAASIRSAGYPTLQYKSQTRLPEYLMLVDSASPRDHEGLWFNLLAQHLEGEGVYLARYFYRQDPRRCWSADGTNRVDLNELNKRHGSHRLLLVGDGDALLDPITGRLLDWTSLFLSWGERALLTPEPPAHWSWREFTLAHCFAVLPATLDGLRTLIDHFDALGVPELRSWRGDEEPRPAPQWDNTAAVFHLRSYLGEPAFRWLCACATYPELQWGLTLRLGSLPFVQEACIAEESLLKLFRLPWFRVGTIPDEWRSVLIGQLDDATQSQVREALVALLEGGLKQPEKLPEDSWAADACRFQLAAQQGWLARTDRKRLRQILESLRDWPPKRLLRDVTVVGLLEGSSRLGLRLPQLHQVVESLAGPPKRLVLASEKAEQARLKAEAERARQQKAEQVTEERDRLATVQQERRAKEVMAVGLLERASSLGLKLAHRLRYVLYPEGFPAFGLRVATRTACAALLTLALAIGLPKRPPTGGKSGEQRLLPAADSQNQEVVVAGLDRRAQHAAADALMKQMSDLMNRGDWYLASSKYDQAITEYQNGLNLDRENSVLKEKLQRAQLMKQVGDLMNRGDSNFASARYDQAIAEYQKGLNLDGENSVLKEKLQQAQLKKQVGDLMNRGDSNFASARYDQAIAEYQRALHLDPENSVLKGNVLQGKIQGARQKQIGALVNQGDSYYQNGNYDQAIDQYNRALALDRNNQALAHKIQQAQYATASEAAHQVLTRGSRGPFSEDEIAQVLKADVPPKRIAEAARQYGISFQVTPETEARLRKAGATDELLAAIRPLSAGPPRVELAGPVLVKSNPPGAQVFLDGELKGTTDDNGEFKLLELRPGAHKIRLTHAGHEDYEQTANLLAGQPANIAVTLKGRPVAPPPVRTFRVTYKHQAGALIIGNGRIEFRTESDGSNSFESPLNEITYGPYYQRSGSAARATLVAFYLRPRDGKDRVFRSDSTSAILQLLQQLESQRQLK